MSCITDERKLSCLLFSDLAGSTALKAELGDEAAGSLIERHRVHARRLAGETAGREIDSAGDGFFLTFATPSSAVRFALRLQQIHAGEPDLPAVRVGVHLGEVSERPAPPGSPKPTLVEGLAVDLASRIVSLALPGQVLMSSAVFDAARRSAEDLGREVLWVAHGPYRFKGVTDAIEIGEAGFDRVSPLDPPPDSDKAWRVARSGNLPSLLPSFVGRGRELAALADTVSSQRLVTIIGPAGCGKTRTAIELAKRVASAFRGGVWLVELGPELEPDTLPAAVARALSISPEPGRAVLDAVADALRYRPSLLVLDNCEHLLEPTADLAERLLETCPELRVVATSREPLRCRAERVFPLDPMATASPPGGVSDAVALFVDRARSEGASREELDEERAAIEELCARLDGLPLAIELAATRARSVGPRQLGALLDARFRVLKARRRPAGARHETLRSAIDGSYEALDTSQRALFDRLSVFAGPFELGDATAVAGEEAGDELDILDGLSSLVDRSMVVALPGRTPTFRLLETLRAYSTERLASAPDREHVRRRHATHFAAKGASARRGIVGPRHVMLVDLLVLQLPEYRTATLWARASGDLDLAVSLAANFCGASYFRVGYDALDWLGPAPESAARAGRPMSVELLGLLARRAVFGGHSQLGQELAERAVAMDPGPESMQARAQLALILAGSGDVAIEWARSTVDVAQAAGDHLGVLLGRLIVGPILTRMGRIEEALEVGRSLLDLADEQDSEHARGWGYLGLGVALSRDDPQRSKQYLDAATRTGRAEKNRYLQSNALLAELDLNLNNDSRTSAAAAARRTLTQLQQDGEAVFFIRRVLGQIAVFLAQQGRSEAFQLDGYLQDVGDTAAYARGRAAAMQQLGRELGEAAVESLRRRGSEASADEALALAAGALDEVAGSEELI